MRAALPSLGGSAPVSAPLLPQDLNVTQSIPKSACRSSPVSSVALIGSHAAFEELGCSTHEGNLLHLQQQPLLLLMLWYAVRMRFTLELLHWPE
ncbi:hypothetical protein AV530_008230 [Patagioenas fasciata monilis]|uniref:Uncharacterized protein n=1 Tax=Patagioenas fasciata monilis TaxID=372326 RepID=A0A1V4KUS8_PATFA|nr:hypothetical protein AV530_008230 [Patagioenas fasciata monilis]